MYTKRTNYYLKEKKKKKKITGLGKSSVVHMSQNSQAPPYEEMVFGAKQERKRKGILSSLPCYLSHEKRLEECFDGFAASPLLIFLVVVMEKKNQTVHI